MKLQKDNIKFIKNMIQCVFIFVWSYYAYVTIYNSTLFQNEQNFRHQQQ